MSEVKVKVLKGIVIAGKNEEFGVGAECSVSKTDAEFLVAGGIAELVTDEKAEKKADKKGKAEDKAKSEEGDI